MKFVLLFLRDLRVKVITRFGGKVCESFRVI